MAAIRLASPSSRTINPVNDASRCPEQRRWRWPGRPAGVHAADQRCTAPCFGNEVAARPIASSAASILICSTTPAAGYRQRPGISQPLPIGCSVRRGPRHLTVGPAPAGGGWQSLPSGPASGGVDRSGVARLHGPYLRIITRHSASALHCYCHLAHRLHLDCSPLASAHAVVSSTPTAIRHRLPLLRAPTAAPSARSTAPICTDRHVSGFTTHLLRPIAVAPTTGVPRAWEFAAAAQPHRRDSRRSRAASTVFVNDEGTIALLMCAAFSYPAP